MREQRGCRYDGHAQLPGTAPTSLLARVQLLETSMARLLEAQVLHLYKALCKRLYVALYVCCAHKNLCVPARSCITCLSHA